MLPGLLNGTVENTGVCCRLTDVAMSEHIMSEIADGVLTLTLHRPEKKNALSGTMYDALSNAVRQAELDASVRVVLFQGEGERSCSSPRSTPRSRTSHHTRYAIQRQPG